MMVKRNKLRPVYAALGSAVVVMGFGVLLSVGLMARVADGLSQPPAVLITAGVSSGLTGVLVTAACIHYLSSNRFHKSTRLGE